MNFSGLLIVSIDNITIRKTISTIPPTQLIKKDNRRGTNQSMYTKIERDKEHFGGWQCKGIKLFDYLFVVVKKYMTITTSKETEMALNTYRAIVCRKHNGTSDGCDKNLQQIRYT